MTKILLRKQFLELYRSFFLDTKKNKARSAKSAIARFVLFGGFLIVFFGALFGTCGLAVSGTITAGYGWFYYALFTLIGIALGAFGSVFNTYSALYLGRDNDILLSLPIPASSIMASRLLTVYLMGLLYSGLVTIPAGIVYLVIAGFTPARLIGMIFFVFLISVFVLVLSCILGYGVARLSLKFKSKAFLTVIASLLFFALYYLVYFKAVNFIDTVVENIAAYSASLRSGAPVFYWVCRGFEGEALPLALTTLAVGAMAAATWYILSRSFLKIASATGKSEKKVYREAKARRRSLFSAMLAKELGRFTGSAGYMLNCGLGTLLLVIGGVMLLIRGAAFTAALSALPLVGKALPVLLAAVVCLISSMNCMAVPSVSLEGKTLWIVRSLPVPAWTALRAKAAMQLVLTVPGMLFAGICAAAVSGAGVGTGVLLVVFCLVHTLFFAYLALYLALHSVNLAWTNETAVIKQGLPMFFAVFLAFLLPAAYGTAYFLLTDALSPALYFLAGIGLCAVLALLFRRWARTRGVRRFEDL